MQKLLFILTICVLNSTYAIDEKQLIAAVLIKEAGGEPKGGMEAVLEVVRNRAKNKSLSQVVLAKKQFSCLNSTNPDELIKSSKNHAKWGTALKIVNGSPTNLTGGSDHYHTNYVKPYWAKGQIPKAKIGAHIFYKLN